MNFSMNHMFYTFQNKIKYMNKIKYIKMGERTLKLDRTNKLTIKLTVYQINDIITEKKSTAFSNFWFRYSDCTNSMKYILRTERDLEFYICKFVGGKDISAVMSILFVCLVVNLLILMRSMILPVGERGWKYEIGEEKEGPVLLDWNGRCHYELQICIWGSVHWRSV